MLVGLTLIILLALVVILASGKRVRGTTLVAPLRWSLFSLTILLACEIWISFVQPIESTLTAVRYFAATSTFLPLMAVLGAKRPQDVGWQFIVLTLWIVLVLPVGEMLVLFRGGGLNDGPMRRWFLLILLLLGLSNYVLTRFSLAAVVVTVGQVLLLWNRLPFTNSDWRFHYETGVILVGTSVLVAWWQKQKDPASSNQSSQLHQQPSQPDLVTSRPESPTQFSDSHPSLPHASNLSHTAAQWNGVWCDFRDAFGLVWGLRVMERVNSTGKLCDWSTELTWYGFTNAELSDSQAEEIDRSLKTVLRRFVSAEWIEDRKL